MGKDPKIVKRVKLINKTINSVKKNIHALLAILPTFIMF